MDEVRVDAPMDKTKGVTIVKDVSMMLLLLLMLKAQDSTTSERERQLHGLAPRCH